MCIIISKPAGVKRLDPKYFDRAWDKNPDGGGLVWKEPNGEVMTQKGFMNKDEFLKKIDELNQDATAFIAHFRIKSVGAVCAENTHPFTFDHVTYAHNGTLNIQPFDGKTDSETFGMCFLQDKTMDWIKEYKTLLEMALGHSKFAIMDNVSGEILILNPELGKEKDGAWFSNDSAFEPVKTPTYTGGTGYGYWNGNNYFYGGNSTEQKANSTFGTKHFKENLCYLDKDKLWRYSSSAILKKLVGYKSVLLSKKGFYIIDPAIEIPKEARDKKYTSKSYEVILANALLKRLYKDLKSYHSSTFADSMEKREFEDDLSALYTVIKAMNKFIHAGKVIDDKEFSSFCLDNTERESWATHSYYAPYQQFVKMYVEDVLDELKGVQL